MRRTIAALLFATTLLAACSSSADTATPPATSAPTTTTMPSCTVASQPKLSRINLKIDGVDRYALVHVPARWTGTHRSRSSSPFTAWARAPCSSARTMDSLRAATRTTSSSSTPKPVVVGRRGMGPARRHRSPLREPDPRHRRSARVRRHEPRVLDRPFLRRRDDRPAGVRAIGSDRGGRPGVCVPTRTRLPADATDADPFVPRRRGPPAAVRRRRKLRTSRIRDVGRGLGEAKRMRGDTGREAVQTDGGAVDLLGLRRSRSCSSACTTTATPGPDIRSA